MISSFEPIIDKDCKILILGTMPGVKSLERQEYYGNERNSFWKIIYSLFQCEIADDYSQKKAFLLQHNIALWDVLKACYREGSSDSNIKNPIPNDFVGLFSLYPNIKAIYFNGEPAEKLFKRFVSNISDNINLPLYRLPSTSPANAIKFERKLEQWEKILLVFKVQEPFE
ncbi:MAG: DNA-deoxyinosine glycosylase [Ruminiclostridium sp.]